MNTSIAFSVRFTPLLILAGLLACFHPLLAQDDPDAATEPVTAEQVETPAAEQAAPASEQVEPVAEQELPATEPVGMELMVNPIFSPHQAEMVFQPLVNYLNQATGYEIRLKTVRNFHRYWLEARRGEPPPLVIEDAHMAAWRMANHDFTPLVNTLEPMSFSLLTSGVYADDDLQDFVGRRISSLPAPSLGYVVLADWFDNPMQQPLIQSNATSWLDAVEIVFSGEADAAMVPRNLVARYPNLYPVVESRNFPGLTLSASPAVDPEVREALVEALTELHDNPDHYAALHELDTQQFVRADPLDYADLEDWLNSIFSL